VSSWLRRAGRGVDATGAAVIWSVAEGRRGRRWREVRSIDGRVASSLLLETDPDGRFSHTELATAAGLLTLHPEDDATLHGNVVTRQGIEHVTGIPWEPDGLLLVAGSVISVVASLTALHRRAAADGQTVCSGVTIDLSLRLDPAPMPVQRASPLRWRIGEAPLVEIDSEGLPLLRQGEAWPLEQGD
jgi:hypothetical protein